MWKKCFRNKMFVFSFVVLVPIVAIALFGPWIAPHDPLKIRPDLTLRPSMPGYWLGTDEFGRDILSRLIFGIRPSMIVALGSTALALLLGTVMGALLMQLLSATLIKHNLPQSWTQMVQAAIILAAVYATRERGKR